MIIDINMDMCIDNIHGIVSHILEKNSSLTLIQVKDMIEKLNPDLINNCIFKNIYPIIYGIVCCEIKLGLYKPRSELNLFKNYSSQDDYDPYTSLNNQTIFNSHGDYYTNKNIYKWLTSMEINDMTQFSFDEMIQEESKKCEYFKKRQNKIIQKMVNQRIATKQKQHTTKFRKY
ncbi:hypothetical protein QJ854_gp926 [Moumouvirus goulette]|uniref:Uncharacterized protein n=1 Tax=Moumouvirus goulette TaxID=1247379 RepID=M1PLR3_9VIRU|nr:hypothetical protein QJ854_gp926 [Moumouvirus goulette]AGF84856.1 hypothetical protein glt_00047 [Moumouvirus goulette]